MRITNGMMIKNSLSNINTNKQLMSIYENQQATEKKIIRPSDDPVIAIRALKYRTTLNEISQYVDKNIPDAESWINTTEGALQNISSVFTDILQYCNQGSTDSFQTDNKQSIIDTLQKLKDTVYAEGNVDFAGRYVFSGYKTDKTLIFPADTKQKYSITQNFKGSNIEKETYTVNKVDVENIEDVSAKTPDGKNVYVIKLAYNETEDNIALKIDGNDVTLATPTGNQNAYETVLGATGASIAYDKTYGQLVMNEEAYKQYISSNDIEVVYEKTGFNKGEVRPEHYFKCADITANPADIDDPANKKYNEETASQDIYYNINYGQSIKVNTQANESIDIYIGRTLQDMQNTLAQLKTAEEKVSKIQGMIDSKTYSEEDVAKLKTMLEAANMEVDYAKKNMQSVFSGSITKMKGYQKTVELAISELGARDTRLSLVKSRIEEQKNNIKELQSKNEDVELEDAVINLSQAQVVYNASLNAAAKIVQQSLIDFI